jgi:hypothetical protein
MQVVRRSRVSTIWTRAGWAKALAILATCSWEGAAVRAVVSTRSLIPNLTAATGAPYSSIDEIRIVHIAACFKSCGRECGQPRERLSAAAFVASVASVGLLSRLGQLNTLALALVSTLIVAGARRMLPVPFEARFSRSVDWWRHGVDFPVAAFGLWVVVSVLPASRDSLCEPPMPWRISIALFGAFGMNWLARAAEWRAPTQRASLFIFLAFCWIAPFYGFFRAPWFLAQIIASPSADRPLVRSLIVTAGMGIAAQAG